MKMKVSAEVQEKRAQNLEMVQKLESLKEKHETLTSEKDLVDELINKMCSEMDKMRTNCDKTNQRLCILQKVRGRVHVCFLFRTRPFLIGRELQTFFIFLKSPFRIYFDITTKTD